MVTGAKDAASGLLGRSNATFSVCCAVVVVVVFSVVAVAVVVVI